MDSKTKLFLDAIRHNRDSGASQLASDGLKLLLEVATETVENRDKNPLKVVGRVAKSLMDVRPSMAPVGNWALLFYKEFEKLFADESVTNRAVEIENLSSRIFSRKGKINSLIVDAAKPVMKDLKSILTLSYSSTVERISLEAAPDGLEIIVAESRPLCEGRKLVSSLLDAGRKVLCITDAQIALEMSHVDMVLLGADTICSDLAVVNKTGSYLAALAAREYGIPLMVAADTFKINHKVTSATVVLEDKPGKEIWESRPEVCSNIYFEPVPAKLVTCFITEKGKLASDEMAGEVENLRRLYEETLFS